MNDSNKMITKLIATNGETLFVFVLSFEDRCLTLPTLISSGNSNKNRIICIDLPDDNVTEVVSIQRMQLKEKIYKLVRPEFVSLDVASKIINDKLINSSGISSELVIDISGMPRRIIFDMLELIAKSRDDFNKVHLIYNHPQQYLLPEGEIASPKMHMLFNNPTIHGNDRVSLIVIPGFNPNETSLAIAQVLDPSLKQREISVYWMFAHGESHYHLYEHAFGRHATLINLYLPSSRHIQIFRLMDFRQLAFRIKGIVSQLQKDEPLFIVNLGPRIICAALFMITKVLIQTGIQVNLMTPERLYYRSLRTMGMESTPLSWELAGEYAQINNVFKD